MGIIINHNPVLKTGLMFSTAWHDQVFTGDLFCDMAAGKFQIKGIPCQMAQMKHILQTGDPGPFALNLFVKSKLALEPRADYRYVDMTFLSAKCSANFATFVEEYSPWAMDLVLNNWEIVPNLHWTP